MKMKMIKSRYPREVDLSLVIEEFIYLLRNKGFKKQVIELRRKYNIQTRSMGKKNLSAINISWKEQRISDFKKDIATLLSQCYFTKSKEKGMFEATIERYVLTNKPVITSKTTLIDDNIKLKLGVEKNNVKLALSIGFDTSKSDIQNMILERWFWIEYLQESLFKNKIGKSKKGLLKLKLIFWEMNKNGKSFEEIADSKINIDGYLPEEIRKMVLRAEARINSSFSQEIGI